MLQSWVKIFINLGLSFGILDPVKLKNLMRDDTNQLTISVRQCCRCCHWWREGQCYNCDPCPASPRPGGNQSVANNLISMQRGSQARVKLEQHRQCSASGQQSRVWTLRSGDGYNCSESKCWYSWHYVHRLLNDTSEQLWWSAMIRNENPLWVTIFKCLNIRFVEAY